MTDPALPEQPDNTTHVMRRIRACESEVPAQLVLEHYALAFGKECYAAGVGRESEMMEVLQAIVRAADGRTIPGNLILDENSPLISAAREAIGAAPSPSTPPRNEEAAEAK